MESSLLRENQVKGKSKENSKTKITTMPQQRQTQFDDCKSFSFKLSIFIRSDSGQWQECKKSDKTVGGCALDMLASHFQQLVSKYLPTLIATLPSTTTSTPMSTHKKTSTAILFASVCNTMIKTMSDNRLSEKL